MQLLKEISIPNEFVTNSLGRDYLMRLKGDINGSSSVKSESPTTARRHLDFHTPRAAAKKTVAGRADDTYPLSSISIKPEYRRSNSSVKKSPKTAPAWEKFKL